MAYSDGMTRNRLLDGYDQVAIFAGEKSATADREALKRAQTMEDSGADRNAIYKETGWFRDGNPWYYEIDDSRMPLPPNDWLETYARSHIQAGKGRWTEPPPGLNEFAKNRVLQEPVALSEYWGDRIYSQRANDPLSPFGIPLGRPAGERLPHPELYNAYPALREMPVSPERDTSTYGQYFSPDPDLTPHWGISLTPTSDRNKLHAIGVHELQHAVDDQEGVLQSGNADDLNYLKKRSEQRAFLAQMRRNLTPEQRRSIPPWETEKGFPAFFRKEYGNRYRNGELQPR